MDRLLKMPALAADYVRAGSATTLSSSRRYAADPNRNHFSYNTQVQPQEKPGPAQN